MNNTELSVRAESAPAESIQGGKPSCKPRAEFLAQAEACGARVTGKPDGSEPIEIVFSVDAWRAFDAAQTTQQPAPVSNEALLRLLNHIEDVMSDADWEKLDVELWNAVTSACAPASGVESRDHSQSVEPAGKHLKPTHNGVHHELRSQRPAPEGARRLHGNGCTG